MPPPGHLLRSGGGAFSRSLHFTDVCHHALARIQEDLDRNLAPGRSMFW